MLWVEKDGEIVGDKDRDRDRGRLRNNFKKWIKILKKEYLNEVIKKNRMFDV